MKNKIDMTVLFDCTDGNPNGDPDNANSPRIDSETSQGYVTDVFLKRRIRDYVDATYRGKVGYDIFVKSGNVSLNAKMESVCNDQNIQTKDPKKRTGKEVESIQGVLTKKYFDIRTFGAVLSTGPNAGQVQGPVQITFGRSIDPIVEINLGITKCCNTEDNDSGGEGKDSSTMGRKSIIPYGLYKFNVFVSPRMAEKTGFSDEDLTVLTGAIENMFEFTRSASKGLLAVRKIIKFVHASDIGNVPSHRLFDLVTVIKNDANKPARTFSDYTVNIATLNNPNVKIEEIC